MTPHPSDETPAGTPPCPAGCAPADEAGKAGAAAPPAAAPAAHPVTTERRHFGERIRAGDRVRHIDGMREGLVTSTLGYTATVQWTAGEEEHLQWGFIERVPSAVAAS